MIAQELEVSLHMAFVEARQKQHEFITVEHLLLAMLDNPSAAEVLKACGVDLDELRGVLTDFISEHTPRLSPHSDADTQPTQGFQRVIQRALRLARVLTLFLGVALFLLLLRILGNAVRDVVDDVEARHAALVQEIDGVRLLLPEDRDQHVGAGDFLLARGLDVQDRALDHALESLRGLRVGIRVRSEARRVLLDEVRQNATQLVEIDAAGLQDLGGRRVVEHREQQVLDRDELVLLLPGLDKGHVEGDFQFLRNHRPSFVRDARPGTAPALRL